MKTVLYIICQCTWGFLQTMLGFIVFLVYFMKNTIVPYPHDMCTSTTYLYHGAIVTEWKNKASVSLGLFVFITDKANLNIKQSNGLSLVERSERLLLHEYGHTIQSLILGPLYLVVIGIPSVLWCSLPYCNKKRKDEQISYYSFYTEKWADHLGEKYII